jgi:dephospho-CoA kinase
LGRPGTKLNKVLDCGEKMLKVGLTGGIGSGKSTVSTMFKEEKISVIDADIVAREIFQIYPSINKEISQSFGEQYFDSHGNLKRRELGSFVFKDKKRIEALETITLPYIIKEIFKRLEQYNELGSKFCIVDAPTLIEVGLHRSMDLNILVWVDFQTQLERVRSRDNLSCEDIINRIRMQMPLEDKRRHVDFIIDNRGSMQYTKEQFCDILKKLYDYEVSK